MNVSVRIFGDLVPALGRRHNLELEEGATVGMLASHIADKAGLKRGGYLGKYRVSGGDLAILVNGKNIDILEGSNTSLLDGDEIVILPPAPGG